MLVLKYQYQILDKTTKVSLPLLMRRVTPRSVLPSQEGDDHSDPPYLLLQIQNHLAKIHDSVKEQIDIIYVLEVVEGSFRDRLKFSAPSRQGNKDEEE